MHPDGTVTPGKTWNPVTGCSKVSPGCAHCYAEGVANRFWATQYPAIPTGAGLHADGERPREFTDVQTHEDRLLEPLSWRKPAKVFVNSMSDLFHEDVPDAFIDQVFAVMALADRHTFQVLTKRPERMRAYLGGDTEDLVTRWADAAITIMPLRDGSEAAADRYETVAAVDWPLSNVWLGVSVENQHFADERIPLLLQTPAAVRFISAEPLLGPVELRGPWESCGDCDPCIGGQPRSCAVGGYWLNPLTPPGTSGIDWVIVGGESGPGARPFCLAWARSIVPSSARRQACRCS